MKKIIMKCVNFASNNQYTKGLSYGLFGGGIGLFVVFLITRNSQLYGSAADWVGAVGTIGAVWLAVSYRRTKVNFDVDAVVRVCSKDSSNKLNCNPKLEIDIFNSNDPSVMIKDIEILKEDETQMSRFLDDGPIVIKGFEAKRIESGKVSDWIPDLEGYNSLKRQHLKINVILFGDVKRTFDVRFVNEDGAE